MTNKTIKPSLTGDAEIDSLLGDIIKTLESKGKEYTVGSSDRLANFRGISQDVGIPMEKAWYVFANKHYRAIQSFVKNGGKIFSDEKIRGRIMDMIVYLLLFYKMTEEMEKQRPFSNPTSIRKVACECPE